MPWFKVDDKLHSHVKAARAGEALALWVVAGSWSMDHLTDGFIPDYMAGRLMHNGDEHAKVLEHSGLWHPAKRDGDSGWEFHDWDEYQPTKEAVEEDRRKSRERMRKLRGGSSDVRANAKRTSADVHDSHTHTPSSKELDAANAARFDEFYALYPKKEARGQAVRAWKAAVKKASPDDIIAGLEARLPLWANSERKFIPNPATWLNGERWTDDLDRPATGQSDGWANVPTAEDLHARRGWDPECPECERPNGRHFQGCSRSAQ